VPFFGPSFSPNSLQSKEIHIVFNNSHYKPPVFISDKIRPEQTKEE
jgi:hypothetical protein